VSINTFDSVFRFTTWGESHHRFKNLFGLQFTATQENSLRMTNVAAYLISLTIKAIEAFYRDGIVDFD